MLDVLCIGNALIDTFLTIHEANEHCRIDKITGELCVKSGEKIPLDSAQFVLGGNACNVSVGLARLGITSGLMAEIGNDAFAHRIKKQLREETRVNLLHLIENHEPDAPSSFAIGINFKGERTLFVQHVERSHMFSYTDVQAKWIYLTSLGEKWRHVYRDVPSLARKIKAKLAFNPGTRQIAAGKDALEAALAVADILFVNKEEAEEITQSTTSKTQEIEQLLMKLQKMGSKTVVITDGKNGSFARDESGNFYTHSIIHTPVIEKTGAGDAFATGFLAATMYGFPIKTAMVWGTLNAASVVGQVGAQPGLLRKEEMERKI